MSRYGGCCCCCWSSGWDDEVTEWDARLRVGCWGGGESDVGRAAGEGREGPGIDGSGIWSESIVVVGRKRRCSSPATLNPSRPHVSGSNLIPRVYYNNTHIISIALDHAPHANSVGCVSSPVIVHPTKILRNTYLLLNPQTFSSALSPLSTAAFSSGSSR